MAEKLPTPYAHEKLSEAIHALVVGRDRIRERLIQACGGLARVSREHLPPELQTDFIRIWSRLTAIPPDGDEGAILATVTRMSEDECVEIVREIETLHARVEEGCRINIYGAEYPPPRR